jgi:hypothetical protein
MGTVKPLIFFKFNVASRVASFAKTACVVMM